MLLHTATTTVQLLLQGTSLEEHYSVRIDALRLQYLFLKLWHRVQIHYATSAQRMLT
jgi:hypothetical protein